MRVLESNCLPLLAPTFLTLCCSSATRYKNKTVFLCKRIPMHKLIGVYASYWLCRMLRVICDRLDVCFLWAEKSCSSIWTVVSANPYFELLCSCKFKAEMLVNKLHFLDNMIFAEGASLKGASSHLDCLLKYLCWGYWSSWKCALNFLVVFLFPADDCHF